MKRFKQIYDLYIVDKFKIAYKYRREEETGELCRCRGVP